MSENRFIFLPLYLFVCLSVYKGIRTAICLKNVSDNLITLTSYATRFTKMIYKQIVIYKQIDLTF